jgi:hypothetical protein
MSNVIYPMSLVCRYRTKAEEKRRHAALMGKSDLRWRILQVAETYDALADNIERVAGGRWLADPAGKVTP